MLINNCILMISVNLSKKENVLYHLRRICLDLSALLNSCSMPLKTLSSLDLISSEILASSRMNAWNFYICVLFLRILSSQTPFSMLLIVFCRRQLVKLKEYFSRLLSSFLFTSSYLSFLSQGFRSVGYFAQEEKSSAISSSNSLLIILSFSSLQICSSFLFLSVRVTRFFLNEFGFLLAWSDFYITRSSQREQRAYLLEREVLVLLMSLSFLFDCHRLQLSSFRSYLRFLWLLALGLFEESERCADGIGDVPMLRFFIDVFIDRKPYESCK